MPQRYLAALLELPAIADAAERRRLWRQGIAALATQGLTDPAPLEGLASDGLQRAVRTALTDGLIDDGGWIAPASFARAILSLASALPNCAERRELGRRVVTGLRDGDHELFVTLATALALSSPSTLRTPAVRARIETALAAPLLAPGDIGALALALVARRESADEWVHRAATGSISDRRLAARLLAHAAREAARGGELDHVRAVFAAPQMLTTLRRLLADREAHVWRYAAIARGLWAQLDADMAVELDHDLHAPSADAPRRAAASILAASERSQVAARWRTALVQRTKADPSLARAAIAGMAGFAVTNPAAADALTAELIGLGGFDAVDALLDLRREEGDLQLPTALQAASTWLEGELARDDGRDDGRSAMLRVMASELRAQADPDSMRPALDAVRAELEAGRPADAIAAADRAVSALVGHVEWLERASPDDALDRRATFRVLRDLDREYLGDVALAAALAIAGEHGRAPRARLADGLVRLERALVETERAPETLGAVPHYRLRLTRLRALVRLLDADLADDEAALAERRASLRALTARCAHEQSPLRRAVWAAMTRAWDGLLRGSHLELSDLLLSLTTAFDPDEDFAIAREATMLPEVEQLIDAYMGLTRATWAAADPDDTGAVIGMLDRLHGLAEAVPRGAAPRTEAVRRELSRLTAALRDLATVTGTQALPTSTLEVVLETCASLTRRTRAARARVSLPARDLVPPAAPEAALDADRLALRDAAERVSLDAEASMDSEVARFGDELALGLPPSVARAVGVVLMRLARLPHRAVRISTAPVREVVLPPWLPMSRVLGGFTILRPIGAGGGGSVFMAKRTLGEPDLFALKVPDYDGGAARNLSEQEFETMFREEAGALLALPRHPNLAGFITFDAGTKPKPILVMELVHGRTLERALAVGRLDQATVFTIIDGIGAGLEAMHAAKVAHLDVKPQNVILRDDGPHANTPVLVDFGLAGRKLRPGCGSPHYGAPEVWVAGAAEREPYAADVYAYACVTYELLTNQVLIDADELRALVAMHLAGAAGQLIEDRLRTHRAASLLIPLFAAALHPKAAQRPTVARVRAGFAAIAGELRREPWPLTLGSS